jgi:hypothetical protein
LETFLQASSSGKDYGGLQKVVRKQFRVQKSGQQRQGELRGDRRGGRGKENHLPATQASRTGFIMTRRQAGQAVYNIFANI